MTVSIGSCVYEGCHAPGELRHPAAGGFCVEHHPDHRAPDLQPMAPPKPLSATMLLPINQRPWKCGHEQADWNAAWRKEVYDMTRSQRCLACERGRTRHKQNYRQWPDKHAAIAAAYKELKEEHERLETTRKTA